jgi:predicted AlkP superfamily pyrophosphatase or phosphodiesterase
MTFNLRNTEVVLSGDRDLNGGTDDNVFKNAMDVISESMPELLWIHFHGIDDYGHTFGPDAPILDEKISEINGYLVEIFTALPEDTLIIYFADHGMHTVHEEGRLGNHGHLIYEDMMVPVIIKTK